MSGLEVEEIESAELELTTLCNAKCKLCFRQSKLFPEKFKKPHARDLAQIQAQLETFKKLRRVELIGQMSDPLCYPQLPQLVRWLKQRGIQISLYTNGSFSQDWIRQVGKELRKDDEVRLTVCGLDQKQHEKYRCETSLAKILEACRTLRKECHVYVVMTYLVFEYNRATARSSKMKLLSSLFSETNLIRNNTFQPVSDFGVAPDGDAFTNLDQKQLLAEIEQLASSHFADSASDPIECNAVQKKHAFVSCFGEVFPCWCFFEANHSLREWSYADIAAKKHPCCRYCQQSVKQLVERNGLGGA